MQTVQLSIQEGELIQVDGSQGFDHGCMDYAILKYIGLETVIPDEGEPYTVAKAEVVEAQSCHSCWQVGHDKDHSFMEVGETKDLTPDKITFVGEDGWTVDIKWKYPTSEHYVIW